MKERIYKIMQKEGLSQGEFAEKIGISQSNLSHIFGARGQKPSLDVVMGIHKAYPYVNLDWLLYGEGEMENGKIHPDAPASASEGVENPIFGHKASDAPDLFSVNASESPSVSQKETVVERIKYVEKPQPKITEIRIFFDNGTFEVFKPESGR